MAEEKKPFYLQMAEETIKALENGTAPWIKPWEPGEIPDSPVNALTGKPYRGINRIRLGMRSVAADPRWCTYKQALELGAQVRAKSRGTLVQYYQFDEKVLKKDDQGKPILDADGHKQYETVPLDKPKVYHAVVFHASQIDGLPPLPPRQVRPEWERHEAAEKLLTASGADIRYDQRNRACYRLMTDTIHLPPRDQFPTPDKYYATALHEVGHWTGHESRLDRDLGHAFGTKAYAREELRAELASYMLGADLGIGHDPGQHHAYVASWIDVLKKDPREIVRAAQDAERIMDYVKGLGLGLEKGQEVETVVANPGKSEGTLEEIKQNNAGQPEMMSRAGEAAVLAAEKTFLFVPFKEKEAAKALGAKWDRAEKKWCALAGVDLTPLAK